MEAAFPAEVLEKLFVAAEAAGVPRIDLERELGRSGRAGEKVSFPALAAAYETAARATGDAAFGLHVGQSTAAHMYGLIGQLVATSSTLEQALRNLALYQRIWSQGAGFTLVGKGTRRRLRYWVATAVPPAARRHESEQMLAAMLTILRSATGIDLIPREVRFEHERPASTGEHERLFRCPLVFNCSATELIVDASLLQHPLVEAHVPAATALSGQIAGELGGMLEDEQLLERLEAFAGAEILAHRNVGLAALAKAANVGSRTLQRRLRSAGISVRAIISSARLKIAAQLLASTSVPLSEIGYRVGYSRASTFHRAFRVWFGQTPATFRRDRQARAPRTGPDRG
jgi:AraC-like DNA-binding protein